MSPFAIALLLLSGGLGFILFRIALGSQWHWALGVVLAVIPFGLTMLFGVIGFLISALFVGTMYKTFGW